VSKLIAPFAPFLADAIYRNLVTTVNPDAPESVHLAEFPHGDPHVVDPRLAAGMAAVRELASLGHSARADAGVKVRQPLGRAVLLVPEDLQDAVEELADVLGDEMNTYELEFAEEAGDLVKVTLRPNYRTAGPELGANVRPFAQALEALDTSAIAEMAATLEQGLEVDVDLPSGQTVRVGPEHIEIRREPAEGTAFAYEPPFGVSLDLEISAELRREGLVREFVHAVQVVRRDAGLEVTDRVDLTVAGADEVLAALREHEDYIAEELLANNIVIGPPETPDGEARTVTIDVLGEGAELRVLLKKA
jgi:isoleucyl-tRNA synthetase